MITANGINYRTISDDLFVNGKKVYKVWANGVLVYPEDDYKYFVSGRTAIDQVRKRAFQTWIMPDWWTAEVRVDVTFYIESKLPIYRTSDGPYENVIMGLNNFSGLKWRGYANGKTETASFGPYRDGWWGTTDGYEKKVMESTQTEKVEQSSLSFGSEKPVIRSFTGSQIGSPSAHVDGKSYEVIGISPNIAIYDTLNNGIYNVLWPHQSGGGRNIRIGWNGSEVYSTYSGGQGDQPGSIMAQNWGTCVVSGSDNPWSSMDEWAKQWIKEYHELYG